MQLLMLAFSVRIRLLQHWLLETSGAPWLNWKWSAQWRQRHFPYVLHLPHLCSVLAPAVWLMQLTKWLHTPVLTPCAICWGDGADKGAQQWLWVCPQVMLASGHTVQICSLPSGWQAGAVWRCCFFKKINLHTGFSTSTLMPGQILNQVVWKD